MTLSAAALGAAGVLMAGGTPATLEFLKRNCFITCWKPLKPST